MAVVVVSIGTMPVDVFEAAGLSVAARSALGLAFHVQNIGQATIRYASAAVAPMDLSVGFRLGAGSEKDLRVENDPTWAWVASGAGRLAMEV